MKITKFSDEYYFLSNFYDTPITYEGITYQNNEAAFQAQKCINPEDRKQFATVGASVAKKLGRQITLRKDWEQVKVRIMKDLVQEKFTQNKDLAELLMSTEDAYLEEGNTWGDRIWGTVNGVGKNQLGQILMEVRDTLRQQQLEQTEAELDL